MPLGNGQQKLEGTVGAGEATVLTFSGLGSWSRAQLLVKAALEAGAALTVSAEVKPRGAEDWFAVRVVDLTGNNEDTLAASVAIGASVTKAILEIGVPGESVAITFTETGESAGATFLAWLVTT